MRIRWLNDEMTRAELTRGWLWWKRVAEVTRHNEGPKNSSIRWLFVLPNRWCDEGTDVALDIKRQNDNTWRKPGDFPTARLLK